MSTATETGGPAQVRLLTRPFVIVTATALVFFIYIGMLIPIVPLFIEGPLGRGEFGIGLTIAVFAGAAILARPFLGRLADRYGRRVLLVGGSSVAGLAGIASSQVTEFWQLLVTRSVMGIGEAAVFVGAATLIADLSPRDRRAEGASYFSVAVFGGIGVGPIIGEFILDDTRFEQAFVVAGCFALLAAVVALFAPARVVSPDAVDNTIASAAPATGRRRIMHPAAVMPGVVLASGVAAFSTFGAFIPDYSREVGLATSGGLFAAYSLTSVLVRIFGATLPERLGPRRAVTIALGTLGVGLTVLAVVPTVTALWVAAVFVGHRHGVQLPVVARPHGESCERQRSSLGDQFLHDVLRGRLGVRWARHRRVRPGGRQADRVLRWRRVLRARALPVALPARPGRIARRRARSTPPDVYPRRWRLIPNLRLSCILAGPSPRKCDTNEEAGSQLTAMADFRQNAGCVRGMMVTCRRSTPTSATSPCRAATSASMAGSSRRCARRGSTAGPAARRSRPKRTNVDFYPTAAAAQQRGFRACKRCRPDASPGSPEWNVRQDVVARAMRLIADGIVEREGVGGLARRVGYSERHLNRVFTDELGAGPLAVARAQRAHTARLLIETTSLPLTDVAFAAGFGSVRQFNDTVRDVFASSPSQLRASGRRRRRSGELTDGAAPSPTVPLSSSASPGSACSVSVSIRLAVRAPFASLAVMAFIGERAIPGVESWDGHTYRRSLDLPVRSGRDRSRRTRRPCRLPIEHGVMVGPGRCRAAHPSAARPGQ